MFELSQEQIYEMIVQQPIVQWVWNNKYRYKNPDGSSDEKTIWHSMLRMASGIYKLDSNENMKAALDEVRSFRWCPGGRQHAGAGTSMFTTLLNCYVSPQIQDSMRTIPGLKNARGILDSLSVAALTQQMGGGIGMDFSTLRPSGALVKKLSTEASGPMAFMDMWNAMCSTIMASGSRRGAMMATMRCDHPDIEAFIDAKHTAGKLTNFNVSVLVTNAFMDAVQHDRSWDLVFNEPRADNQHMDADPMQPRYVYKRVSARALWDKIIKSTYDYAEPGVIFIDRVNAENNLYYMENIQSTNPCGEQPLPPNGNCNLGAVNLALMVKEPFTSNACVDYEQLRHTTKVGMRWLDNVIDVSNYPTPEQESYGKFVRRTGLGITGLANMLQQLRLRYGSPEALDAVECVMESISINAYEASIELASERGPFPAFDRDKYLASAFVQRLPVGLRRGIERYGIRNGVLLTIAPTGTTSLYYGNVSSGLEPTFAWSFNRKTLRSDGQYDQFTVQDFGMMMFRAVHGLDQHTLLTNLPDYMVTAQELTVDEHLLTQASCQKYIDSSVSKTINVPTNYPFEDFKQVYTKAYMLGCKGCTTYRYNPDSGRGAVLEVKEEKADGRGDNSTSSSGDGVDRDRSITATDSVGIGDSKQVADGTGGAGVAQLKPPRPAVLVGKTYKVKWPGVEQAFYVTINDDEYGHPFEMFINSKSVQHQEWVAALTRTISAVFRRGGDVSFLVEELEQVHSQQGFWIGGKFVPSLVALIGGVLAQHLNKDQPLVSFVSGVAASVELVATSGGHAPPNAPPASAINAPVGEVCPKCNAPALVHKEGCQTCLSCGYSNCG